MQYNTPADIYAKERMELALKVLDTVPYTALDISKKLNWSLEHTVRALNLGYRLRRCNVQYEKMLSKRGYNTGMLRAKYYIKSGSD